MKRTIEVYEGRRLAYSSDQWRWRGWEFELTPQSARRAVVTAKHDSTVDFTALTTLSTGPAYRSTWLRWHGTPYRARLMEHSPEAVPC